METTNWLVQQQQATVSDILVYVPQALDMNTASVVKATAAGQAMLDTIEAEGMTPAIYEGAQALVGKLATTFKACNDRRMPFFREVEVFRKQFTELEAQIDPKVKDSIAAKLQEKLDEHVTALAKIEADRVKEAKRKMAFDQERITLKNDINALLIQHVNGYIADAKKYFNTIFETITLETIEKDKAVIAAPAKDYTEEHFNKFHPTPAKIYHTDDELLNIIFECKKDKFSGFAFQVARELKDFKAELLDKVPSKKIEMESLAEALRKKDEADLLAKNAKTAQDAADALLAQAKAEEETNRQLEATRLRQKEEQEKLDSATAANNLKAQQEAETIKQTEKTQNLFDSQMNSMAATIDAPAAKEGYVIKVLNPAGFLPIVMMYFDKEGLTKQPEELEKKTLKQMMTFCEKQAMKDEKEKIESPYVIYETIYSAVKPKK